MRTVKPVAILIAAIGLTVVVVQNTASVPVRFFWWRGEMPMVLLLFLTAMAGFVLGLLVAFLTRDKRVNQSQEGERYE